VRDRELLADLAEGGDVRGDAATPTIAVTLGAGELREVVRTSGDAGAGRSRPAVRDCSDHRHRLRHGLGAAAGCEGASEEKAAPEGGSEPCDGRGAGHGASIRRSRRSE
jgi:hypothetical protein